MPLITLFFMKPPVGIDHEKMVSPTVFDTFALGEANKEKLERILYRIDDLVKLPFGELSEEGNQTEFAGLFNELINLISSNRDRANQVLVNELTFYYETLRQYDAARNDLYYRELRDLQSVARRILSQFKIIEEKPKEQPKVRKHRETVRGRVIKHLHDLLGRSHDK